MRGKESLEKKATRSIINNYSKEQLKQLERTLPENIWSNIERAIIKKKYKDVMDHLPGFIEFNKKLKEVFITSAFWDLTDSFRFYLGPFEYKFSSHFKIFIAQDFDHAPEETIPFYKFYVFDNICEILFKYLSHEDEHLLRKLLIYYPVIGKKLLDGDVRLLRKFLIYFPKIGEKHPEFWNYTYNFGKKKKKKKKKKLSSDIKKKCKKKGIRLTYKRNGKRIYKSEKVLKKQLANRN